MPRKRTAGQEATIWSPEDGDIPELFVIKRHLNPDGSIKYVQLVGEPNALDDFANNRPVKFSGKRTGTKSISAPRIIMQRKLGRPLTKDELVRHKNGRAGDLRRGNLELTTQSEVSSVERNGRWSETGEKYVYAAPGDRFYANANNIYLGTYDTKEEAAQAIQSYNRLIEEGMDAEEARVRIKRRSRTKNTFVIQP